MKVLQIWKNISVKFKILFTLIPVIVLILIILKITSDFGKKNTINSSGKIITLINEKGTQLVNDFLESKTKKFVAWTKEDIFGLAIEFETVNELSKNFDEMLNSGNGFNAILLADKNGTILTGSMRGKKLDTYRGEKINNISKFIPRSPHSVALIKNTFLNKFGFNSAYSIMFTYPSHNLSGEVNGVVIAYLNVDQIQKNMRNSESQLVDSGFSDGETVILEMQNWEILSHSDVSNNSWKNISFGQDIKSWMNEGSHKMKNFPILNMEQFVVSSKLYGNDFTCKGCHSDNVNAKYSNIFNKPNNTTKSSDLAFVQFIPKQNVLSAVNKVFLVSITIGLVGIAIIILITWFIASLITSPITKLKDAANKVADGNVNVEVKVSNNDEVGQLSFSFNKMVENIRTSTETILSEKETSIKKEKELQKVFSESEAQKLYLAQSVENILSKMELFADGDLTVNLAINNKDDDIGKLFSGFNRVVQNLRDIILKFKDAVTATTDASSQIVSNSEEVASGTNEQSAQTNEVATAIEEMTSTILESTKNASVAADSAEEARTAAIEGGNAVTKTVEGMNEIAEVVNEAVLTVKALGKSSNQIGEIIQVIDDIADQTNLLALNAAIEAARAGEQGRGFAVVADEVRKLAERTTKATKEIATMIKQIQKDTKSAVESINEGTHKAEQGKALANHAGESLKQIIEANNQVKDIINQVAATSEEQSTTAAEISKNVVIINEVTQQNAGGVQNIAKVAEELNNLTSNLETLMNNFKIDKSNRKGLLIS